MKTFYYVYGENTGETKKFKTLKEAKEFIKSCDDFDKRNDLPKESWTIEKETEN